MGGSIRPIGDLLQMQKEKAAQQGAAYEAPAPANVYKQQQQTPYQEAYQPSPFVQQQMQQLQRMQQMQQMQPEIKGLGQQDYVSPLQSMLNNVLYEYSPQQFNPQQFDLQAMMQQGMPSYSGPAYRPDMAQVHQNLNRVSAPYIPPPPPAPEPAPDAGGGGE
jgi:hypothetical protein